MLLEALDVIVGSWRRGLKISLASAVLAELLLLLLLDANFGALVIVSDEIDSLMVF